MPASASVRPAGDAIGSLLPWILRAGVAACFIGHGMLGVLKTSAWTSYFVVFGIGPETAFHLMPLIGLLDIAMALSVLLCPNRWLLLYMVAWCFWTALLRPLAGESVWEAVERAGNYGAALALFLILRSGETKTWLRGGCPENLDESRRVGLAQVLRLTTVWLLLGHGLLHWIVRKPLFVAQYNSIGLPGIGLEPLIGVFECLLALAVLFKPGRLLLLGVVAWKLATEALSPIAGSSVWVFIEHGGSYAAPLALAFLACRAHPDLSHRDSVPFA